MKIYRVSGNDSLFDAKAKSKSPWLHPACTCTVSSGHVTSDDKCRIGADNLCTKGKRIEQHMCKLAVRIPINTFNGMNIPARNVSKDTYHDEHLNMFISA